MLNQANYLVTVKIYHLQSRYLTAGLGGVVYGDKCLGLPAAQV